MSKETDETQFKSFVKSWQLNSKLDSDHTWQMSSRKSAWMRSAENQLMSSRLSTRLDASTSSIWQEAPDSLRFLTGSGELLAGRLESSPHTCSNGLHFCTTGRFRPIVVLGICPGGVICNSSQILLKKQYS